MYIVYVLYSESYHKHYTGYTTSLAERILSHNEMGKDWTARYRPWKLLYTKEFKIKSEAMSHDKWLKTGVGREFIKRINK